MRKEINKRACYFVLVMFKNKDVQEILKVLNKNINYNRDLCTIRTDIGMKLTSGFVFEVYKYLPVINNNVNKNKGKVVVENNRTIRLESLFSCIALYNYLENGYNNNFIYYSLLSYDACDNEYFEIIDNNDLSVENNELIVKVLD